MKLAESDDGRPGQAAASAVMYQDLVVESRGYRAQLCIIRIPFEVKCSEYGQRHNNFGQIPGGRNKHVIDGVFDGFDTL